MHGSKEASNSNYFSYNGGIIRLSDHFKSQNKHEHLANIVADENLMQKVIERGVSSKEELVSFLADEIRDQTLYEIFKQNERGQISFSGQQAVISLPVLTECKHPEK